MGLTAQEYAKGCLLRIVAQPNRYDQGTWQTVDVDEVDEGGVVSCPTTGCVAGTAASLAGDMSVLRPAMVTSRAGRQIYEMTHVVTSEGKKVDIRSRGQELLELNDREAGWLFSGHRTLPEVIYALIELSEGKTLSCRYASDMSRQEQDELLRYRGPRMVKRERKPAAAASPMKQEAGIAHGD